MQRNENANEVTIKDIKNIKELKNLSDEEATQMLNAIKEFCLLIADTVLYGNEDANIENEE
jgi:hypothetical protein